MKMMKMFLNTTATKALTLLVMLAMAQVSLSPSPSSSSSSSLAEAFAFSTTTPLQSNSRQQQQQSRRPKNHRLHSLRKQPFSSSSSSLAMSSSTSSFTLPEGMIKQTTERPPVGGEATKPNLGDIVTVKYTCYGVTDDDGDGGGEKPFAKSTKQKMVVGDGSMINGWDYAIRSMEVGERALIRVVDTENLGYGQQGVPPLIKPNQQLEFDITLLDCQPPTLNIDFDSIATLDNTPRTASEIAAAYEQRQAVKAAADAATPQKEGLEAWIDKAKSFYFFGFFEGETGQQAPWILRPSITFPIAFAIVGAAFYVSVLSGAISEKGAQSVDELDEIILSSTVTSVDAASHVILAALSSTFSL